jgi:hypothetical protein
VAVPLLDMATTIAGRTQRKSRPARQEGRRGSEGPEKRYGRVVPCSRG